MKKILYCCPYKIDPTLGGAKVYIEAALSFKNRGWEVTLISPDDLGQGNLSGLPESEKLSRYSKALDDHLKKHSAQYDVVEYEHLYLPFPRSNYSHKTLMVGRSILLTHQFTTFTTPSFSTLRGMLGKLLKHRLRKREFKKKLSAADKTLQECDFVTVPNKDDKKVLTQFKINSSKVHVIPYGLFPERRARLSESFSANEKTVKEIAFVGTFDLRKGAKEFPDIIRLVSQKHPDVRFKLLGTSAMFPTREAILQYIPGHLHSYLDIVPKFSPEDLPILLRHSKIGIFPSHMESFGFGVLEMMAAGLPVVAYDVPGPNELLPPPLLVKRADHKKMADKIIELLESKTTYEKMVELVTAKALEFDWNEIAIKTEQLYLSSLEEKKNG